MTREHELRLLLNNEDIDIAFITETDTKELRKETDYLISGFKTFFPSRKNDFSKIRILAFVKDSILSQIKLRTDLMSNEFPSIWLEFINPIKKNTLIAGFYRQWSSETCKKKDAEEFGMNINVWNKAPIVIKECKSLYAVKKPIKLFVRTLPI